MPGKITSHPQHPLYVPGLIQPSQLSSEVISTLILGGGTQGPPGEDGAPGEDAPIIPGPRGPAGQAGADGRQGPPGMDGEPADDWPLMIPGPQGPQGNPGAPGGGGGGGTAYMMLPALEDQMDDAATLLNVTQDSQTGHMGIKFTTGQITLGPQDSVQEGGDITFLGAAAYDHWAFDNFQGRMRLHSGGSEWARFEKGVISVLRNAGANGAFNMLSGTTNLGMGYVGAADNYQIRYNDDMAGNQLDATKPSWAIPVGEGALDRFSIYRRPPGGAYVAFWALNNAGHWTPETDNTRDVGTAALRTRALYTIEVTSGASATSSMVLNSSSVLVIGAGTAFSQLNLCQLGVARWHLPTGGHLLPVLNNTYDVGSAALMPRNVYAATSFLVNNIVRINTTRPVWTAATTTVNRAAVTNATTLANLAQAVGTLINDLRSIGILG